MTKTIRKTYPRDFSVGVLVIIFTLIFFLAGQLFDNHEPKFDGLINRHLGEFLVSTAVLIMILILWEEILFPVTIKPLDDGLIFRNHRTKLKIQALIYLAIPAIIVFLYFTYEVNTFRFFSWAAVCLILPVIGKLISGINNYNDFLTLTPNYIDYKNNELEGRYEIVKIDSIQIIKNDTHLLQKLELKLKSGEMITIDLDEMELEDFYESIEEYIQDEYQNVLV